MIHDTKDIYESPTFLLIVLDAVDIDRRQLHPTGRHCLGQFSASDVVSASELELSQFIDGFDMVGLFCVKCLLSSVLCLAAFIGLTTTRYRPVIGHVTSETWRHSWHHSYYTAFIKTMDALSGLCSLQCNSSQVFESATLCTSVIALIKQRMDSRQHNGNIMTVGNTAIYSAKLMFTMSYSLFVFVFVFVVTSFFANV